MGDSIINIIEFYNKIFLPQIRDVIEKFYGSEHQMPGKASSLLQSDKNSNAKLNKFALNFLASPSPLPVSYTHLTLPTILLVQISVVAVSLKKKHTNPQESVTPLQKRS
eukprot:TRINITY_DN33119_c0_g1_i1.p1 TRINITY_DN33119_c0_g1~~TRINITY_DN33119_c0_g1_i1.p1  ORF type:complete len:109 (+),score=14.25 TRINITY_DN33119_c0_g1_i1:179-505(+)